MRTISSDFIARMVKGGPIVTRCEVLDNGVVQRTLDISAGSVQVDLNDAIRRRAKISLTDPDGDLTPAKATDLLAPFGNELRLHRGYELTPSGLTPAVQEILPVFTGGISGVQVNDTPSGLTIDVDAYDRARRVQRSQWVNPYVIGAGTNFGTAVQDIVRNRYPLLTEGDFLFTPTSYTTPKLVFGLDNSRDPWKAAQDMAASVGFELFFDAMGVCTFQPIPDYGSQVPVFTYAEGEEAIILGVQRSTVDEETYSHWIVSGTSSSNTGVPPRGEAKDTNPESPTYYLGDFGDVPNFWSSPYVVSVAQATTIATALLNTTLGSMEEVNFPAIVNPAHEAGDVVAIVRKRARIDDVYVMENFSIPLDVGGIMSVKTKRKRTQLIEAP